MLGGAICRNMPVNMAGKIAKYFATAFRDTECGKRAARNESSPSKAEPFIRRRRRERDRLVHLHSLRVERLEQTALARRRALGLPAAVQGSAESSRRLGDDTKLQMF
jgi:hypothetical protein